MTIPEMLGQSATLTILGMGVVFAFLVILIMCMKLVEILVKFSGADKEDKSASFGAPVQVVHSDDRSIVAAIAAALKQKN
jgi:oxaloacetate decarboxylase (Na+ extruding) subunit gamma